MIHREPATTNRSGTHLLEMAFVVCLFFFFIFAIFEYGRYLYIRQVAQDAVREAARAAVVANTGDSSGYNYMTDQDVKNIVINMVQGLGILDTSGNALSVTSDPSLVVATVTVTGSNPPTAVSWGPNNTTMPGTNVPWMNTPLGQPIGVQINGAYKPMFPTFLFNAESGSQGTFLGSNNVPIVVSSIMSNESNQ
jgi:Flp pilus assembly protein TadG